MTGLNLAITSTAPFWSTSTWCLLWRTQTTKTSATWNRVYLMISIPSTTDSPLFLPIRITIKLVTTIKISYQTVSSDTSVWRTLTAITAATMACLIDVTRTKGCKISKAVLALKWEWTWRCHRSNRNLKCLSHHRRTIESLLFYKREWLVWWTNSTKQLLRV